MNRKAFIIRDQDGNPMSIDSVEREHVIMDSFDVHKEVYKIFTQLKISQFRTLYPEISITKDGKETGAKRQEQVVEGYSDYVYISLNEKEEIEDAWMWLHPGETFLGWRLVEEKNKFIAKLKEWKADERNSQYYDEHRHFMRLELEKKKDNAELIRILDDVHAIFLKKRGEEMEELKISEQYLQ